MELKRNWGKNVIILTGCLFGLMILIQHHYVMMYYEDYHYFRFAGLYILQMVQAVIVIAVCCFSGIIAALATGYDRKTGMVILLVLYGLFDIQILRDGIYYYSASILYFWPLLPFLGGVYCLLQFAHTGEKKYRILTPILFFLAAFLQDQTAAMVLCFTLLLTFFAWGKYEKFRKDFFLLNIVAVIGLISAVVLTGSRISPELYETFYAENMMGRITRNILPVIQGNAGKENLLLTVLVTVTGGVAAWLYFKKEFLLELSFLFTAFFFMDHVFKIPAAVSDTVRILWFLIYLILFIVYYLKRKQYLLFSMLIAGCCSQGILLLAPVILPRCHVAMAVILHILAGAFLADILANQESGGVRWKAAVKRGGMALLASLCFCILIQNLSGYRENAAVYRENERSLSEAGVRLQEGAEMTGIALHKLPDDLYAGKMPYQTDAAACEEWIKEYYRLPSSLKLHWIEENGMYYEVTDGSWHKDGWMGKSAEISFFAEAEQTVVIKLTNAGNLENMKVSCQFQGEETVYELSPSGSCQFKMKLPEGTSTMKLEASETFVPENGDERNLSVLLGIAAE